MKDRRLSARSEARRRWGKARVLRGGRAEPPSARRAGEKRARARTRPPGTAPERRLAERILGRRLSREELADAIRLLRAGARLKELEISGRVESILHPERE